MLNQIVNEESKYVTTSLSLKKKKSRNQKLFSADNSQIYWRVADRDILTSQKHAFQKVCICNKTSISPIFTLVIFLI